MHREALIANRVAGFGAVIERKRDLFMRTNLRTILTVVLAVSLFWSMAAGASVGPESDANRVYWDDAFRLPGIWGNVAASVRDSAGTLYIAGEFYSFEGSFSVYRMAKWNGTSWSPIPGAPVPKALAADNAGNVYVGGTFTTAGGVEANNIAKWDGTTWTPLGSGVDNTVYTITLDNAGNVYAGGYFSSAGGVAANYIAKWDGSTWAPLGGGVDATVRAIAIDNAGNVYTGGDGGADYFVCKWNGSAWSRVGGEVGGAMNAYVNAMVMDGAGNLYAGGGFTTVGGSTMTRIAKWDGTSWTPLGSGTDSDVLALAIDNAGNIYAGGWFSTAGGSEAKGVAKWDGAAWHSCGAGVYGDVKALLVDDAGNVCAGGVFHSAGEVSASNVAKWDGAAWSAYGTGNGIGSGFIYAVTADDAGNVYIGGDFRTAANNVVNKVARWDGAAWAPLGAGVDGRVYALMTDNAGNLFAGGAFSTAGGETANNIAKWDGAAWTPLGSGLNGNVRALAMDKAGNLYAAGTFSTAGGEPADRIAKWDGAVWTPLGSGVSGTVYSLATDNAGNVYAGGKFGAAGGAPANNVAKWDGAAWAPLGGGLLHSSIYVNALVTDDAGHLYAAGQFSSAGGVAVNNIAKWDGVAWAPLGSGLSNIAEGLAFDDAGNLFACGFFSTAGGVSVKMIARWDGSSWSSLGSGTGSNYCYSLAVKRNTVFVGGNFPVASAKPSHFFAVWQPRVNQSAATFSGAPGAKTLGNDVYGFYKPALMTDASTTVSYSGTLPITLTLNRADEILVDGKRINGAFTLGPEEVQFNGSGATLRVEFSEDDAAAFGVAYTDFRAAKLTYPADYPANMEAASVTSLGAGTPVPIRIENGKQIYAISVPLTAIGSTYGAVPQSRIAPPAATNPGAVVEQTAITWTWAWTDNSNGQADFKVFDDPGAGAPTTLQTTVAAGAFSWRHNGLTPNCQYACQVATTNGLLDGAKTAICARYTLAGPPSVGNNIVCDKPAGTSHLPGAVFTFTNPAGFGPGTHGGSAYKVSQFRYAWDTSASCSFSEGGAIWNSGALAQVPTSSGAYYLHLQSINGLGMPCGTLDYGPFLLDADPPVPIITGATTLTHTVRTLTIDFGEHVNGFSLPSDVLVVNGTASNLQATANPGEYTVDILGTGVNTVSVSIPEGAATDDATNPNNEMVAPFTFPFDGVAPSAAITLMDEAETGLHEVHFRVLFSEPLPFPLSAGDVSLTDGSLAGTIGVEEINTAQYTVTVALQDPKAQGTVGITLTPGAVTDEAGNPNEGAVSPLYTIQGVALPAAGLAGLASLLGLITLTATKKLRGKNR